jgi:hypothetical protein
VGGIAGRGRLFVISSHSQGLHALVRNVFPGCSLYEWNADMVLKGKVKQAADFLLQRFSDPATMRVKKSEVREAANIVRTATFSSHVMRNPAFRYFMNGNWIDENGQYFERVEPFAIIEGGYVYEPPPTLRNPG